MSEERATYTAGATMPPALDLDAIERRANAATPGTWLYADTIDMVSSIQADAICVCEFYGLQDRIDRDAPFIAHARTDVPALVAEVRRLRAERNELHTALRAMAQSWLSLAKSYEDNPHVSRYADKAEMLQQCARELAGMWEAVEHPILPTEDDGK